MTQSAKSPLSEQPVYPTRLDDFYTVRGFTRRYPELGTEASHRWSIFHAETNGLAASGAIVRLGRKIWLLGPIYLDYLLSHRVSGKELRKAS